MYSLPDLEPVYCPMSGSNCGFLTCIQISQETGKVIWYSHLFKNSPENFLKQNFPVGTILLARMLGLHGSVPATLFFPSFDGIAHYIYPISASQFY